MQHFRFVVDINDLSLPKTCTTDFPDPDDLLTFKLIICPDEGNLSITVFNSNVLESSQKKIPNLFLGMLI